MASNRQKRWLVAPEAPISFISELRGVNPVLAQVLYNRGLTTVQDAREFVAQRDTTHNPMTMVDIGKAVGRLRLAISRAEPIVVYGDFDADGVTSTTLLVEGLRALGAARVLAYIPSRVDEGYGLNTQALDSLYRDGYRLIVTVDCGIRAIEEVAYARKLGIDIIITDHHTLGPELPNAYAVINCKREGYREDMLAGVGVAYKLLEALLMADMANGGKNRRQVDLSSFLDLVAIGTVADLMPLNRLENRSLVRRGLEILREARRPGIAALLQVANLTPDKVNAESISFVLGPRINAAGRLANAMIAYEMLSAKTLEDALPFAMQLQDLNVERQERTREAQELIRAELEHLDDPTSLIFAGSTELTPGIVGLVAGKLTEEYYLPSVIMEYGETESRASCRSIPQFDITRALDQCADLLVRHGGHALAAGFTVVNENLPALRERLTHLAREALHGYDLAPTLDIDAALDVHRIDEDLHASLRALEPTGNGNRNPVFTIRRARIADKRTVGQRQNHLKLSISRAGRPPLDAIGFNLGHWESRLGDVADLAFTLEINEWKNTRRLQLKLEDVQLTQDTISVTS